MDVNLKRWDEIVDINAKSKLYDLDGFKSGKIPLLLIERVNKKNSIFSKNQWISKKYYQDQSLSSK